jgi:branched-chain amino acid transport system ATP-binding protein
MTRGLPADGAVDLSLEGVSKHFGGLRAVCGVTLRVPSRSIVGLIGPNGAGKTTLFNLITGVYRPDAGTIRLGAVDLAALRPAQIAAAGVGRTFQNIRLFARLTALENVLVACELGKRAHLFSALFRTPLHFADEAAMRTRALELLRVFELGAWADAYPSALSYGHQRRLEIARAMMTEPRLLLLDEPAAGMSLAEADALEDQIRWLRDTFGVAVLLVEHNVRLVMRACDALYVLDHGETIAHGAPSAVRADPKVLAAYLGAEEGAP